MPAKFQDQVVLITGAASGIGRATTLKLATQGASLAICDINMSMLTDIESILPENTPVLCQKVDVSSEEDVVAFVKAVVSKFGRLDHVFNCAGLNLSNIPFDETSLEYFDKQIGVNVKGVFLVTRESLKHLKRGASIVMVSSMSGTRGTALQSIYTREIERELIPCLRKYGMELVTYNPLCGGLFSGKIKSGDLETPPTEGRFSDSYQWGQIYRDRYLNSANMTALKIVEEATKKYELTMLETALRWMIHHSALNMRARGGNDGVVVGVSTFQQLKGNLRDLEKDPLPADVVEALDKAWWVTRATAPSYWR